VQKVGKAWASPSDECKKARLLSLYEDKGGECRREKRWHWTKIHDKKRESPA